MQVVNPWGLFLGDKDDPDGPLRDDSNSVTLASMGDFIPFVIGRRRIGALIAWVGERTSKSEGGGGGGGGGWFKGGRKKRGGGGASSIVYRESGWHVLCVGPATKLHRIWQSGKEIFTGPIDSVGTPSGSTIDLGEEGQFTIFWGEEGQPENAFLGNFLRVTVTSRWPFCCYIVWTNKRLGQSPRWSILDYEIEVAIQTPLILSSTPPQHPTEFYPDGEKGENPAHAIAQMLFAEEPHGLNLDQSKFDIPSLESLGTLLQTEKQLYSSVGQHGQTVTSLLADVLQDAGVYLALDIETGLLVFKEVREVSTSIPSIPADMVSDPLPEIRTTLSERLADNLAFEFDDVDKKFTDSTILMDDDGQALDRGVQRIRVIRFPSVIDFQSAATLAERRSQEELAGGSQYTLHLNRAAEILLPGRVFFVENIQVLLRCVELKHDGLTGRVVITAIEDYYGAPDTGIRLPSQGEIGPPIVRNATPDALFTFIEVPGLLLNGQPPTIITPRVRNNSQIVMADIHISRDNVTFIQKGREFDLQTGGALDTPLSADTPYLLAQGPEVFLLGPPDTAVLQDLSADPVNHRLGRQLVLINEELMFCEVLTPLGLGVFRMDGLIRARFDTIKEAHAINDDVFVFPIDEVLETQDALIAPLESLSVKTQPIGNVGVSLAAVTAVTKVLYGKGIRPPQISNLRIAGVQANVYFGAGPGVTFRWSYTANAGGPLDDRSGAGFQNAGDPIVQSLPDGNFILRFKTLADVLVRTEIVTITDVTTDLPPTFLYTNANITTDLGGLISFKLEIVNAANGRESTPLEITVERE